MLSLAPDQTTRVTHWSLSPPRGHFGASLIYNPGRSSLNPRHQQSSYVTITDLPNLVSVSHMFPGFYCRTILCVSAACRRAVTVGQKMCILSKRINMFFPQFFHHSIFFTIQVFLYQALWQYADADPSDRGLRMHNECEKSLFSTSISFHSVSSTHTHGVAGSKRGRCWDGRRTVYTVRYDTIVRI